MTNYMQAHSTETVTPESRMQGNLHVRFGGGPLEKGSGHGLPRWRPTQHLYRLPSQWVDYDPRKKQFAKTPTLPPSALPKPKKSAALKNGATMPANGVELQRRVHDYDARLAQQGVCQAGELVKHIVQAGVKAGYEADLATWTGPAIALAVGEARAFEARLRRQKSERKEVA
jgi:hypothetical protein